ncbi:MAG TPA: hypothetical protein VEK74_02910 [Burkholderiaceae bacterium]|nr:hypothetical protein [Burkholderiaceae bacterium]
MHRFFCPSCFVVAALVSVPLSGCGLDALTAAPGSASGAAAAAKRANEQKAQIQTQIQQMQQADQDRVRGADEQVDRESR